MANKRGRPRKKPKSIHELREQAQASIRKTKARQLGEASVEIEAVCEQVDDLTHRNRFTQEEMNDLKDKVNKLYDSFVVSQQSDDQQMQADIDARVEAAIKEGAASEAKAMTEDEWNMLHRLRPNGKRKPGPKPAKKKNIYSLEPGDSGLATERTPSQDCEEIERQWLDNYIEAQRSEPKFLQGVK